MKVRKSEELRIWQIARQIARDVYALTRIGAFAKDYGLKDQIQRAAVSIGSNIAEGFERDSNLELMKFLGYAKGSAGEVRSQLQTAQDIGYVGEEDFLRLHELLTSESRMISRFQASLRNSSVKGRYYKEDATLPSTCNHPPTPQHET